MEIFASTQNPTEIQALVATVLGVPMNRINVRVKRLGVRFLPLCKYFAKKSVKYRRF
jgi:xanthine dehydrogenase molybdopterin-binding subunit B